jgi:hypothetical protein
MRTRLLFCLAGGCLGAVTSAVGGSFGISPILALAGCSFLGVGIGYVASICLDIFVATSEDTSAES